MAYLPPILTRWREITFSGKWPPHPRAEGGQVEPVLASGWNSKFMACCGLEQSRDQEGQAEQQQAGNPE